MPRKGPVRKRPLVNDPVYGSPMVTQLVNRILLDGKKSIAERIVYGALEGVAEKSGQDALTVLKRAMDNIRPSLEVRSRRVGGATYQVPVEVKPGRATTEVVAETITKKVVNKKVLVGTGKLNLARLSKWNKIAKCESGGRWHINTRNGYYGGLQFNLATWRSVKGQQFAKYPHKASKAEQITVANRLYAKRGFKPWSCRHVL